MNNSKDSVSDSILGYEYSTNTSLTLIQCVGVLNHSIRCITQVGSVQSEEDRYSCHPEVDSFLKKCSILVATRNTDAEFIALIHEKLSVYCVCL